MNIIDPSNDTTPNDPTEIHMGDQWNIEALVRLIRRNTARGYMPSLLLLGRREAGLLRQHLAEGFDEEEQELHPDLHYAGLRVVETRIDSLTKVAGERMLPEMERASKLVPVWKDDSTPGPRWRFDAGLA